MADGEKSRIVLTRVAFKKTVPAVYMAKHMLSPGISLGPDILLFNYPALS